jgi:Zn-dependent M28 family amino/carboxypeptidase
VEYNSPMSSKYGLRFWITTPLLVLLSTLAPGVATVSAQPQESLTVRYQGEAGQLLGAALVDTEGWDKLSHLTTVIGHRLSGSEGLERAIAWSHSLMKEEGLSARLELVMVPHWVRGKESLELMVPDRRPLAMLGLGGSVGTGPEGVTAEVVVVQNFEELTALGRPGIEGKIVVYAVQWEGYGNTVRYRSSGASRAAEFGAVGALVRSATGSSLYTPHTGALRYSADTHKIPAAAITVEDAMWMLRYKEAGGSMSVQLKMEARTLPDAPSANVIAEIRGSELPGEVVVMGGHYDSWDVGQGAHDDGAACMAAWQALTIIHKLGLKPRRTLRVVLWTNEENGGAGGRAYREGVGDSVTKHVAAIEMDGGCERPVGFGFTLPGAPKEGEDEATKRGMQLLGEIGALLKAIDGDMIRPGGHGADISPLMAEGVPGLALETVREHYFDWHHTNADTLEKVDLQDFRKSIALLAVMGYVLADMPETLGPR